MNKLLFALFALFALIFSPTFAQWNEETTEGGVGEGGEGEAGANEEGAVGEGEFGGEESGVEENVEVDPILTVDDLALLL